MDVIIGDVPNRPVVDHFSDVYSTWLETITVMYPIEQIWGQGPVGILRHVGI